MFIKNLANGMITEVNNEDVVKTLMSDNRYKVADTKEALDQETESEVEEVETEETETEDAVEETKEDKVENIDYSEMKLDDLRKVAKEKGIQGYSNMSKVTLVEVIKAHE